MGEDTSINRILETAQQHMMSLGDLFRSAYQHAFGYYRNLDSDAASAAKRLRKRRTMCERAWYAIQTYFREKLGLSLARQPARA